MALIFVKRCYVSSANMNWGRCRRNQSFLDQKKIFKCFLYPWPNFAQDINKKEYKSKVKVIYDVPSTASMS